MSVAWENLLEIVRLLRPSYEERQQELLVERECIAADLLASPWAPPGFTLAKARHLANYLLADRLRGGIWTATPADAPNTEGQDG